MAAEEAMMKLREQQESESKILITTIDAGKNKKPVIVSLTINLGKGLRITRTWMSYYEFLTSAQNLKS